MKTENKRPTLRTIAKIAGVSHVTVSQALRDFPEVSDSTKQKIKLIAKELGYTPNICARNLALNRPNTIGMIVPAIGVDTAYNEAVGMISMASAQAELCLLLGNSERSTLNEESYCRMMCGNRVGALIISPCTEDISRIKKICQDIVPLLFIGGRVSTSEKNYIFPDYDYGMLQAVEHLMALGHSNIAFLAGADHDADLTPKESGYINAMQSRGLIPEIYRREFSLSVYDSGYNTAVSMIKSHTLPTAIICACDMIALGVWEACKQMGLSVPQDISIIGHDNLFFTGIKSLSLSTMSLPMQEMANLAISFIKELIDYGAAPQGKTEPICKRLFKPQLIERGSTSIPRQSSVI